jgi:hypothetical protein
MSPTFTTQMFSTPQDFLEACAPALEETRAPNANFPIAPSYAAAKSDALSTTKQWWLAVSSPSPCLAGKIALFTFTVVGTLPGCLASSLDPKTLTPEYIKTAMEALVSAANEAELPASRLTSVCGPSALGLPFADAWGSAHNLKPLEKPIVVVYHSYVTKDTLRPPLRLTPNNVTTGKVRMDELDVAGNMLVRFGANPLRPWSLEGAKEFAAAKIEEEALYGARVDGELKAIATVTRPTPSVKAIEKVSTVENSRGKGLAEIVTRQAVNGLV